MLPFWPPYVSLKLLFIEIMIDWKNLLPCFIEKYSSLKNLSFKTLRWNFSLKNIFRWIFGKKIWLIESVFSEARFIEFSYIKIYDSLNFLFFFIFNYDSWIFYGKTLWKFQEAHGYLMDHFLSIHFDKYFNEYILGIETHHSYEHISVLILFEVLFSQDCTVPVLTS